MMKKPKEYKRLPGVKKGFFSLNSLWTGTDHLLSISSFRFVEDYKRFYYQDIEAIVVRKTLLGKIQNLSLVLLAGFVIFASLSFEGAAAAVFWTLTGAVLLLMGFNFLMGPTCVCHLQTAVQNEKLPSLHRLRTARKAIKRLRPLIEAAQGTSPPEGPVPHIPSPHGA
jgi:hypothetical protein